MAPFAESESPVDASLPSRRRRWFPRYSLTTLLVVGVVLAVALGFLGREFQRRQERAALIEKLSTVGTSFVQGLTYEESERPGIPVFMVGDDSFSEVCLHSEAGATDEHVALLRRLDGLCGVHLFGTSFTDAALDSLGDIDSLETLGLYGTSITGSALSEWKGRDRVLRFAFADDGTLPTDDPFLRLDALGNVRALQIIDPILTGPRVDAIARLKLLRKLYVESIAKMDQEAIDAFGDVDQVVELRFSGTHAIALGDPQASAIAGMESLETLSQTGNALTDRGMRILATAPRLAQFNPNSPLVTDEGVRALAQTATLRDVDFYQMNLTDESLESLASLPNLQRITVQEPVTKEAASRFAKTHPKCLVWWFGDGNGMEIYNQGVETTDSGWHEVRPFIP